MSKTKSKPNAENRQFVTALARGLDLLRCFDRPGVTLTVSELARLAGLSQPTAWRLAYTLLKCGYLTRAPNSAGLRIGVPALTLGYAAIEGLDFPVVAQPTMQQITERLGITTTLSFRQGPEMISISRCDGDFVRPNQPVGWRVPLTALPSGLAVLAALPAPRRQEAIEQVKALNPARWTQSAQRVEAAMDAYAQDGYVLQQAMMKGQYAAVAVPLLDGAGDGGHAWGLSCGGLAAMWTEEKLRLAGRELLQARSLLEPAIACTARASS